MLAEEVRLRFVVAVRFPELSMLAEFRSRFAPEIVLELVMFWADKVALLAVI